MTREEKSNLLNELLEYEENNDIGNLTRAERREFQQWISKALEQEPKTGHWIYPYGTTTLVSICSECGTHGRGNFCPNCGVKMIESEDEE